MLRAGTGALVGLICGSRNSVSPSLIAWIAAAPLDAGLWALAGGVVIWWLLRDVPR